MKMFEIQHHDFELVRFGGQFVGVKISHRMGNVVWAYSFNSGKHSEALSIVYPTNGNACFKVESLSDYSTLSETCFLAEKDAKANFTIEKCSAGGVGTHDIRDIGRLTVESIQLDKTPVCFSKGDLGINIHYSSPPSAKFHSSRTINYSLKKQ